MAYLPPRNVLLVSGIFLAVLIGSSGGAVAGHGTGAAGGICVDNSGRNVPCSHRSSGGSNRRATVYNNRGVNLLNRGYRTKSLATVTQAIANFRRANAIQPHWIHQRNLFAARTYYWTLKASKTSNCPARLSYMRNATRTMHYYPAHKKRNLWSRVRKLERLCRQVAKANANRQPVRSPITGPKGVQQQRRQQRSGGVGVADAVTGDVQMCSKGKCRKVKPGQVILFNGVIVTGKTGRIQIRFTDNTVVTVGPNTQLVIDKYAFGADPLYIKRGLIRWVSGLTGGIEKKIHGSGFVMAIRGTDFVLRLNPATRTLTVELLEGALSFKPTGGQAERAISPGVWVIKWFERRTGRQYRIRRVRAYRSAGDRVLARRRAYYDRTLPRKVPAGILKTMKVAPPAAAPACVPTTARYLFSGKNGFGYVVESPGSDIRFRCRGYGKCTGTWYLGGALRGRFMGVFTPNCRFQGYWTAQNIKCGLFSCFRRCSEIKGGTYYWGKVIFQFNATGNNWTGWKSKCNGSSRILYNGRAKGTPRGATSRVNITPKRGTPRRTADGKPYCKDVGGYEAYMNKTGKVCRLD